MRISNSANALRNYYYNKYLELKKESNSIIELNKKMVSFLNDLRKEDVDLFNTLIGLLFCDKYILNDDLKLKNKYKNIKNINELLNIINNEAIIDIYSSINFFKLSNLDKVKCIDRVELSFLNRFSIVNFLEKYLLYSNISLDEIGQEYNSEVVINRNR